VKEEILNWHKLNHDEEGFITNFNFILIDEVVEWDEKKHDFNKLKTTALPAFKTKIFKELPIWANLQHYCKDGKVQTSNANYEWEVAKIKAFLLGKKPDEIIDEVSKGKRVFRAAASIVIAILLVLTVFAFNERNKALRQRDIAISRELILNAEKYIKVDPQLSINLAIAAATKQLKNEKKLSPEMRSSMLRIIKTNGRKIPFNVRNNAVSGGVESFAISPDQTRIALGSQNDSIWVLDTRTFATLFTLNQNWTVSLKWSADGKYIASAGQQDKSVNIWNAKNGALLKHFEFGESGGVMSVDWRVHTHQLSFAIAMGDNSKVEVYDFDRNVLLFEVPGIRAAWSPDGKKLATGGVNDESWSIRVYSPEGVLLCKKPGHHRYVHDIAWKPDNNSFVTSSVDDQIIVWDAQSCAKRIIIPQNFPLCSSWSPDMKFLAIGGGSEAVKIYDVHNRFRLTDSIDYSTTLTGDKISETSIKGYVLALNWSKDGKNLLLSDREGTVTFVDTRLFGTPSDLEIVSIASSLKKRELTDEETRHFLRMN
jgi:WD40 repeat protein